MSGTRRAFLSLLFWFGIASGIAPASAEPRSIFPRIENGTHAGLADIAVDRSERVLATVGQDHTIRLWDLQTGRLERTFRPRFHDGIENALFAIALSPDGESIFAAGSMLTVLDRRTGRTRMHRNVGGNYIAAMAVSNDGARLAVGDNDGNLRILRTSDLKELLHDRECNGQLHGLDFDVTGRLVVTCFGGSLRLFDASGKLIAKAQTPHARPFGVKFSPDGAKVALGYLDSWQVDVFSAANLSLLFTAPTERPLKKTLWHVAWSADGKVLHAGGHYDEEGIFMVASWPEGGRGKPSFTQVTPSLIRRLAALGDGRLVIGCSSLWGVLDPRSKRLTPLVPTEFPNFRVQANGARLSPDARRVQFPLTTWRDNQWKTQLARFDIERRTLDVGASVDASMMPSRTEGLPITDWDTANPKLDGKPLAGLVPEFEHSISLAISPDASGFALGTLYSILYYERNGTLLWGHRVGAVHSVNIGARGRYVVATIDDGTVRWYDAKTGAERFALYVHARDQRWVLWTPEGFFDASPGAESFIGYQMNQAPDREDEFVDSSQLASLFFRPDLLTKRVNGDEAAIQRETRAVGDVRAVLAAGLPPIVTLLSPRAAESDGDYELRVQVRPSTPAGQVGDIKVFINGAEIQARTVSPPGGGMVTQRLSLAPGENIVSVRAMRLDGKVASNEVSARVNVRPSARQPVLRILAVGISDYEDAAFKGGVKFASRDAEDLVKRLREGASGVYREVDAKLLTRRQDTALARIEAEMAELVRRSKPEDVVVVFLAGHGKAPDGEYHFIPADFVYDSDQAFKRGTLSHSRLESTLKGLGAGKRLLILDTCDSGTATQSRDGATEQKDAVARLMRSSGRYILAAASPQGKALESGIQGHGIYTYALMEGLAGGADPRNSGMIEVDALADFVSRRVPELTEKIGGYRQRPMRSAQGENFPFVRRVENK